MANRRSCLRIYRRYRKGKKNGQHYWVKSYGAFPLGKEKSLVISWDKEKLKEEYDAEEILKQPLDPKEIYIRAAKGLNIFDPFTKQIIIKKVPWGGLPRIAKIEANLIRGGFFNPATGQPVHPSKVKIIQSIYAQNG